MRHATDLVRLREHLPEAAFPVVVNWLRRNPVQVRMVRPRMTKLGDFRSATRTQPHRVTVNTDLNKYAFLVTLVHEFAHFSTFTKNRRWTPPHGEAWKSEYARLMRPFLSRAVLPADVLRSLERHLQDAPASSCTDHDLMRVLRRYDRDPALYLEELPHQSIFRYNQRLFVKGQQLRKRFQCRCLNDRRTYFFDPMAEVHIERPLRTRRAS
ncbi:MAG: sprT domain-containing protein [Flavobacteriales bacterium]|nr:sprT domain-containing protein [Flavobacteriales bacterium]MCB9193323.1 sprT domain-containing protein [Flavobacteriales bacterium]